MKKKILFAVESLAGGGAEKILTTIVRNLDHEKYEITVLTVVESGFFLEDIKKYSRIISMLPDYNLLSDGFSKLRYKLNYRRIYSKDIKTVYAKFIKEIYDVEIAFIEGFATKLIAASPNQSSKKYAWVHTDMICNPHADRVYASMDEQKQAYRTYHNIFTVSKQVSDAFKNKFGNEYTVEVQYNPVDSKEINKMAKQACDYQYNLSPRLITCGRLEKEKGYDRLLEAIRDLVRDQQCELELWILGKGSERKELEKYIIDNKLETYVKVLGFQSNPYCFMKRADIFVCSSRAEGFSTVATEALILDTPVITTECAGMRDLFGESNCGMIVPNTKEGIRDALEAIIRKPELIHKYKIGAQNRAKDFSIEKRMREIEDLLDA